MVQEYQSPVRVHKFTFEMVMAAYERRFPNCPQIPVVVECLITDDSWSSDDSQRQTTRRCQLNVEAPYLLKKMIGVDYIYFIQKNNLDLKKRVLEIEATNETFSSRVGVVEKCKYYVHPDNPEWTCFEQSALLDVKNFFGLESTVEKIAMKQYAANIAKGKELIDVFMKEVYSDGVTCLNPWKQGAITENRELRRILSRGTEPLSPMLTSESRTHTEPGPAGISKGVCRKPHGTSPTSASVSDLDDTEKEFEVKEKSSCQKKGYFQRGRQKIKRTLSPLYVRLSRSRPCSETRSEIPSKLSLSDEDLPLCEDVPSMSPTLSQRRLSLPPLLPPLLPPPLPPPLPPLMPPPLPPLLPPLLPPQLPPAISSCTLSSSQPCTLSSSRPCAMSPGQPCTLSSSHPCAMSLGQECELPPCTCPPPESLTRPVPPSTLPPCTCPPTSVATVLTRWDNLLVVLVCATLITLMLSSPLSVFFGRRERRR